MWRSELNPVGVEVSSNVGYGDEISTSISRQIQWFFTAQVLFNLTTNTTMMIVMVVVIMIITRRDRQSNGRNWMRYVI
jgi:hypothetical protein